MAMSYRETYGFRLSPVWILIIINITMYIAKVAVPDLVYLLGLNLLSFPSAPWTLVTSLFIHANIWHILFNMWTLYFFGTYLSRLIGWGRFLLVYFCGGMLGGAFFLLLASPLYIAIGASGAIFALGGALAVMRPNLRVFVFPVPVPIPLWIAIIGGFFIISLLPGIAWQAHLGGMLFGLITGYFFRRRERTRNTFSGYVRY